MKGKLIMLHKLERIAIQLWNNEAVCCTDRLLMLDLDGSRLAVALTLKFCFCKKLNILGKKANTPLFFPNKSSWPFTKYWTKWQLYKTISSIHYHSEKCETNVRVNDLKIPWMKGKGTKSKHIQNASTHFYVIWIERLSIKRKIKIIIY